jgi:hypothetical protein
MGDEMRYGETRYGMRGWTVYRSQTTMGVRVGGADMRFERGRPVLTCDKRAGMGITRCRISSVRSDVGERGVDHRATTLYTDAGWMFMVECGDRKEGRVKLADGAVCFGQSSEKSRLVGFGIRAGIVALGDEEKE